MMNIVIVGGGAIGLLFYHGLTKLNNINLSLLSKNSSFTHFSHTNIDGYSRQVSVTHTTKQQLNNADIVLLCVKSYQVNKTISELTKNLSEKAIIILCHNGMGTINTSLPHAILMLLTTNGAKKTTEVHIIHTGLGMSDLGCVQGNISATQAKLITDCLNTALPSVYWRENILQRQWLKLAINCVINPLTAINNMPNGDVLKSDYQSIIDAVVDEFILVARAQQIPFDKDDLLAKISDVAQATARNTSSMLSDITKQQPTEIDYINGYIVRLGEQSNITTPMNKLLCQQVKALTK